MQILKTFAFFIFIKCMEEIWKDIPGFEGKYQASTFGNIKSLKFGRWWGEGLLKTSINKRKGRRYATLFDKNGKPIFKAVSIWVALTFLPNPKNLPEVHHIDHNKLNDHVDNLMWISREDHKKIHDPEKSKRIACYKSGELFKIYNSIREAERDGFARRTVQSILQGGRFQNGVWVNHYTTKGCYTFKYI